MSAVAVHEVVGESACGDEAIEHVAGEDEVGATVANVKVKKDASRRVRGVKLGLGAVVCR